MKVIREIEIQQLNVDGTDVKIIELVWSDGRRSFDVHRLHDGADLTIDASFDAIPSYDEIAYLIAEQPETWRS